MLVLSALFGISSTTEFSFEGVIVGTGTGTSFSFNGADVNATAGLNNCCTSPSTASRNLLNGSSSWSS